MPHSKDLAAYPDEFWQVVQALTKAKTLRLEFEQRGAAISWRGRFHSWRLLVAKGGFEGSLFELEEFSCLKGMMVRIEPTYPPREERLHKQEAATVVLEAAEATPAAKAIRAALQSTGIAQEARSAIQSVDPSIQSVGSAAEVGMIQPISTQAGHEADFAAAVRGSASEEAAARFLTDGGKPPQESAGDTPTDADTK